MNNKLLLLNLNEVEQIVLLDEACDPPSFANWDSAISEGEIPLAVYEALEDYDPNWEEDEIDVIQEIYEFGEHFHEDEVIAENAICQQQEELLEKL